MLSTGPTLSSYVLRNQPIDSINPNISRPQKLLDLFCLLMCWAFRYYMTLWVGIGGIGLVVGREWENFMAIFIHGSFGGSQ